MKRADVIFTRNWAKLSDDNAERHAFGADEHKCEILLVKKTVGKQTRSARR